MRVLIVGDSGGIGAALAEVYGARGDQVQGLSRSRDGLDLLDEASVARAAEGLDGELDRIVVTTGILSVDGVPPETAFARIEPEVMARSFAVNAIGPALLLKHLGARLPRRDPSVFAVLSARLGSIGDNHLGGWMSYRASKAALNQIVRCAAVEIGRKRPGATVVALHPGTVPTTMTEPFARGRYTASAAEAARQLVSLMDGLDSCLTGTFVAYDGSPIPW